MYGAILGDIIGQPYEFHNIKTKDFPLFSDNPRFTDDTVMTVAVFEGILKAGLDADEHAIKTCDEIRSKYSFDERCQRTVPPAIQAFLEGKSFEDVIRIAVSLGGDCDTLTCIATSMAEAFYGLAPGFKEKCLEYTSCDMHEVLNAFDEKRIRRKTEVNLVV